MTAETFMYFDVLFFFFFQAEDGIRDFGVTGVQTCALPIYRQTSFRAGGGSRSEVSATGDRRKCQTYTASPAEPGGLPVMLGAVGSLFYHQHSAAKTNSCCHARFRLRAVRNPLQQHR